MNIFAVFGDVQYTLQSDPTVKRKWKVLGVTYGTNYERYGGHEILKKRGCAVNSENLAITQKFQIWLHENSRKALKLKNDILMGSCFVE